VLGLILTAVVVTAAKNWTEVPRPSRPLVTTDGWAFPSGHAAYAVSYVVIALALSRIGGVFTRAAFVVAAFAFAAAVALSRVYLRAHYLTDVIGGAAVAFLVASLLTVIALLTDHVRNNRRERAGSAAAAVDKVV
jgi:undecaprenyl-diphosphatase